MPTYRDVSASIPVTSQIHDKGAGDAVAVELDESEVSVERDSSGVLHGDAQVDAHRTSLSETREETVHQRRTVTLPLGNGQQIDVEFGWVPVMQIRTGLWSVMNQSDQQVLESSAVWILQVALPKRRPPEFLAAAFEIDGVPSSKDVPLCDPIVTGYDEAMLGFQGHIGRSPDLTKQMLIVDQ